MSFIGKCLGIILISLVAIGFTIGAIDHSLHPEYEALTSNVKAKGDLCEGPALAAAHNAMRKANSPTLDIENFKREDRLHLTGAIAYGLALEECKKQIHR
jgi:hypothetical protein